MSNVSGCRVEHFDVDFGVLQIFGPTLQQDRTCVSSMACQISGIEGTGLGSGDSLMLLETCSSGAMLEGLPAVPSSTLSGSSFDWTANLTEIVMSSPGGLYRLCWCMRGYPCDLIEHFVVDMGALHVIGPAPLTQHRTCYSGQSCLLDGLVQIGSTDLAKILVLETCGTSALIRPPSGHAIPSGSDTSGRADVTGQVRFAAGGLYRLCWCGQLLQDANTTGILGNASGQCKLAQNFGVDMGDLTMLGPAPLQQDRTCVAGGSCLLEGFLGTGMEAGSLLLLETCGVAASADFGASGRPGQPRGPTVAALLASGAAFRWEARVPAAPSGGSFRLCWCAEKLPQNLTNYTSCAISSDFTVDMGMLHVMGPLAGATQQQFTCVGGQRCSLDPIRGLDLLPGDQVLVLDTCGAQGMPADVSGTFVVGGLRNSVLVWDVQAAPLPGGQYRLCWCGSQSMSTSNHTSQLPADCKTDAGSLSILSPTLHQQRTCVSGQTCSLDGITGYSLSPDDAIMVLGHMWSPDRCH